MEDLDIYAEYKQVLPVVHALFAGRIGTTLTDREKILLYLPAKKLDLKCRAGDTMIAGSGIYRAVQENKRIVARIKQYGTVYSSMAIPIHDQSGTVIGSIAVTQSVEAEEVLREMAEKLAGNLEILASNTEEISAQTEELSAMSETVEKVAQEAQSRVNETDKVIQFINGIAGQTNLLGLNAAIEAARVGDQGRGFGVVAEEIRKLAVNSTESTKQIGAILHALHTDNDSIYQKLNSMNQGIEQINQASQQVAQVVQEVSGSAQEINGIADELFKAE